MNTDGCNKVAIGRLGHLFSEHDSIKGQIVYGVVMICVDSDLYRTVTFLCFFRNLKLGLCHIHHVSKIGKKNL